MVNPRSRDWCFTSWDSRRLPRFDDASMKYLIIGKETCPDSGREHRQCYVEFKSAKSISAAQRCLGLDAGTHFEKRKGSAFQASEYCKKEGNFQEFGLAPHKPQPGKRTDLEEIRESLANGTDMLDVADKYFGTWCRNHRALDRYMQLAMAKSAYAQREGMKVSIYWGSTGTGKTMSAFQEDPDLYKWSPSEGTQWWDGYTGQKTLLIDEFNGQLKVEYLLAILDRYRLQLQVKGGFTHAAWTRVIITSNTDPEDWYSEVDPKIREALDRRITEVVHFPIDLNDDCEGFFEIESL